MSKTYRDKHRARAKQFDTIKFKWWEPKNELYQIWRNEFEKLYSFHNKGTWRYYAHRRRWNREYSWAKMEINHIIKKDLDKDMNEQLKDYYNGELYSYFEYYNYLF